MHSPKSSLASNPSLASESNRDSTRLHNSLASLDAPVVLLINLSPLSARCALDLVRWSFALIFLASRAEIVLSSISDEVVLEDLDLPHPNFCRILDVADKLLFKIPAEWTSTPHPGSDVTEVGLGLTLQTTMESLSSSSVTSTKSCWLFLLRSLRNIGNIAPPSSQSLAEPESRSSGKSNVRL